MRRLQDLLYFGKFHSWRRVLPFAALLGLGLAAAALWPPGVSRKTPRLVLLGLDGLDWTWLDARIAAGGLPSFARLRREGLSGPIQSLRPLLSPILWTTIATGVGPDRHGVLDFLENDASGASAPITSRSRRAAAFWDLAPRWKRSVGVVNWFGSWPAEKVPGWMVSDRLSYHSFFFSGRQEPDEGLTWPPELLEELRPLVVTQDALPPDALGRYFDDLPGLMKLASQDRPTARRLEQFRHLLSAARTYQAVTLRLMETRPTDLLAVYLDSFDTAAHLFAPYIPPRQDWIEPGAFRHFSTAVARVTEDLDAFLGEVMARLGPADRLLVVSDHGFRTGLDRLGGGSNVDEALAAEWHRPEGVAALHGAGVPHGPLGPMSVLDVLPSLCALLGVAPDTDFEGKVPLSVAGIANPFPAVPGPGPRQLQPESAPEDGAAAEVVERLEALGYIGSGSADTPGLRLRVNAYNNLGVYFHKEKKDYARAEEQFRLALMAGPDDPATVANLASLRLAQKRFDEALALLQQVLERQPQLLNVRINLAICLRVLGRLDEARGQLEAALAQDRAFQPAWWNLGLTEEKAGLYTAAAAAYAKAAALTADPAELAEALNAEGLMRAQTGDLDRARAAFEKAAAADPDAQDPRINLANVEALGGHSPQARRLFEAVLARQPDSLEALNGLAQLDLREGRTAEARARLEHSLRLDPGQERIRQRLAQLPR